MPSQINSQVGSTTKPQGSPYCTDPECESCKELREMQERIRSDNFGPQIVTKTVAPETRPSGDRLSGNHLKYRAEN